MTVDLHSYSSRRGVALVIVLAILALILGLCVGFLSHVSTERVSSHSSASAANARLFADTAVQLVQGQIDVSTTQGSMISWSSQPGLIRTYDSSGSALKSYKLYSSGTMQVTGALNPSNEVPPATWYNAPALYTDLNEPVASVSGTTWPILDPSSFVVSGTNPPTPQGFRISDTSTPWGAYHGVTNPAPMPVQWLYMLKDGTLVAPAPGGTGNTVIITGATAASGTNPIVGRIAFWTDDETCKINANTASEGSCWDTPKANTNQEVDLANYQPVQNEFQAFPGHPATTSLSAVLTDTNAFPSQQIFSLVPRLQYGGSQMGTVVAGTSVTLDADRLYPNVEEMLFSGTSTGGVLSPNPGMNRNLLEQNKFFITTTSRAPEVNLFNLPKVACWPISSTYDNKHRTAFDNLIAFCSTLNGHPFYFQRQNSHSTTNDYNNIDRNQKLYSYLQNLMARNVPGFGGNLASKFDVDADQILTEIFDYIRCTNLWDGNLPVNTGQFTEGKKDGVATSKNLLPGYGQVVPIAIATTSGTTQGFGRYTTISEVGVQFICTADGLDTSGTIQTGTDANNKTVYVGRNNNGAPASNNPAKNLTLEANKPLDPTPPVPLPKPCPNYTTKQLRIEAALLLEHFCPMLGFASMRPDLEIKIAGLENWAIQGNADTAAVNLGFPSLGRQTNSDAGLYLLRDDAIAISGHLNWGGPLGIVYPLFSHGIRARNGGRLPQDASFTSSSINDGVKDRQYPFVSEPVTITVSIGNPQMALLAGPLTITALDRSTGATVQTLNVNFPGGTMPAPSLAFSGMNHDKTEYGNTSNAKYDASMAAPQWWTFQAGGNGLVGVGRFASGAGKPMNNYTIILSGDTAPLPTPKPTGYPATSANDVVRSAVPVDATGRQTWDSRLLAASPSVSSSHFAGHPSNDDVAIFSVSAFTEPITGVSPSGGIVQGTLAPNVTYGASAKPDLPFPISTQAADTGDWDNGLSYQGDGPYINKPDEGNASAIGTASPPYFGNLNPSTGVFSALFTSPNRTMSSPVMFGSLSTGVKRDQGWQTLLFRRQPNHPSYVDSGNPSAPKGYGGFANAPDYLMLDFFWMPVVQPYAISEPLSTSGKINMNEQIIPFTYITRDTGLYAVLKNEKVMAIPKGDGAVYKALTQASGVTTHSPNQYRHGLNIPAILQQFQFRYNNTDGTGLYAFRTPAEICDMHIIPDNASVSTDSKASMDADMATYWSNHALTGDNTRERPYATIYPRLTTKSNTFTVHFRVQALKQIPSTTAGTWAEGRDIVTAEYRGSSTIDRFLNPRDPGIQDYAADPNATPTLDSLYHWRTRAYRQFAP